MISNYRDVEAILEQIEAIDLEMVDIQRLAVTQGKDLRSEWDGLFAQRTALELNLWSGYGRETGGISEGDRALQAGA